MKHCLSLGWLVPTVSALAGVCFATALTASCSTGGCDCPAPRQVVTGTFDDVQLEVPESAPASLRDIEATRLVIEDGTAVLHYTRGAEAGSAMFTFGSMY